MTDGLELNFEWVDRTRLATQFRVDHSLEEITRAKQQNVCHLPTVSITLRIGGIAEPGLQREQTDFKDPIWRRFASI